MDVLKDLLSRGMRCGEGDFTLARPDVWSYEELVHRFWGCQNEKKCDQDDCPEPYDWEEGLVQPVEVIRSKLPTLVGLVEVSQALLAIIIKTHGPLMRRRRTKKKSVAQRKAALQNVRPYIAPVHRPDIIPVVATRDPNVRAPSFYGYHTLPFINIEDLSKSESWSHEQHAPNTSLPTQISTLHRSIACDPSFWKTHCTRWTS